VFATLYDGENPIKEETVAYIKQDDGEFQQIDCLDFLVSASEKVQFKFASGEDYVLTEELKVVDVNFGQNELKLEEYFVSESDKKAVYEGMQFTFDQAKDQNEISFVNVLSISNLNVGWVIPSDSKQISLVTFTLTDYYDSSNKVVVEYVNEGETAMMTVNGERVKTLSRNFKGINTSFYYDANQQAFYDSGTGKSFAWKSNFKSDRVFLTVNVKTAEEGATFIIDKINEQWFSEGSSDSTTPNFYIETIQQGVWGYEEEVFLPRAIITDVMTPFLKKNAKFRVRMPDGTYAVSTDQTVLDGTNETDKDYTIKLTQFGRYLIMYSYEDQNGLNDMISYPIIVNDRRPPSITLKGVKDGEVKRVKVGEKVKPVGYTVSDGETATKDLKSYVAVYSPVGVYLNNADKGFKTNLKGAYRIIYYCVDEDENYVTATYTVIAE